MFKIKVKVAGEWRNLRTYPNGPDWATDDLKEALDLAEFLTRHGIRAFPPIA